MTTGGCIVPNMALLVEKGVNILITTDWKTTKMNQERKKKKKHGRKADRMSQRLPCGKNFKR